MALPPGNINIVIRRPDVPRRRSARQALASIPDSPTSNNSSPSITRINTHVTTVATTARRRFSGESWSSAPSPDELVIQKRGRRKSIVWSPEVDSIKREGLFRDRTPGKTPKKNQTPLLLRDTPRKRLSLEESDVEMTSPEQKESTSNKFTGNLAKGLQGLSHGQLIKIIMDLVTMQEEKVLTGNESLSEVILKNMPIADIVPLGEKLSMLRQNVCASLVSSNLDEADYNRAYVHLETFYKTLKEQGQNLLESQHWVAVIHYVFAAWATTKDLPEWKNQGMHSTRRKCFRLLTEFCYQALKNGTFSENELSTYKEKLQPCEDDYPDIQVCLQHISEMIA